MAEEKSLTAADRARHEWQIMVEGMGEAGQTRLKNAAVLVTRLGGVGGEMAQQLAMAGVGKLVLAHAGDLKLPDLNRQALMSEAGLGRSRVDQAAGRLRQLNSAIELISFHENISVANVAALVSQVDVVASCAPLFEERLLLNQAAVAQGKTLVDCAMFEMEVQLTTVNPGITPCLACIIPQPPPVWKRQFPVFGAVAGTVGALGAMEVIKIITGLGTPLAGQLLLGDLRTMAFRRVKLQRRPDCSVCQ